MTLDIKVLEAALKAAAKVYASQNSREPPTPSDIEGTAEDLRSPINAFLALADLVPRKKTTPGISNEDITEWHQPRAIVVAETAMLAAQIERDEALRLNKELSRAVDQEKAEVELQTGLAETQGRHVAALRAALGELADFAPWGGTDFAAFTKWVQGVASDALTDTAAAAASYRLVDEGYVVVPVELLTAVVDTDPCRLDHHGYCQAHGWMYEERCPNARLQDLLATTSQAGEPEDEG